MKTHLDSTNSKRTNLLHWRSPEEVLRLKEGSPSPTSVGVIDITVYNELKRAYDSLKSENTELRAIVEIMEAKTLKDASLKKCRTMDESDLRTDIQHNQHLILRLQHELQNAQHDVSMMTKKLDQKRKLFLGLQESLQSSTEECLDLRRSLERAHLELAQLQDEKSAAISSLEERLSTAMHRADISEKRSAQLGGDLGEAKAEFAHRVKRYAADLIYVVATGAYKRVVGKAMRQWRACTAASVVHVVHVKQTEFLRDRLRGEHMGAMEALRMDFQHALSKTENELNRARASQEALLRRCFHSSHSVKSRVFARWTSTCLGQVLQERDTNKATLASQQLLVQETERRVQDMARSEASLCRSRDVAKGASAVANILMRGTWHRSSLRKAYRQWLRVLLIKRAKVTEFVENYNKLSDALEREQNVANSECTARAKAERKVEAYRNITSSMASVIRYQGTLFRCFSSWKQYTHEQKLWRIGNWPELWRLSRLCPDESDRANLTTSDIMHLSADRAEQNRSMEMRHTAPARHVSPPHNGVGPSSVHSQSSGGSRHRHRADVSDDAWQEPRRQKPPHAQPQRMYYVPPSAGRGNGPTSGGMSANTTTTATVHEQRPPASGGAGGRSSTILREGGEFDTLHADEMSEVLGQYDEYANDFEDTESEGEGEEYRRGGVFDAAGSTLTSNMSTGSLLFSGTAASSVKGNDIAVKINDGLTSAVAGGTFASTGDFSTATKLFRRGAAANALVGRTSNSNPAHDHSAVGEKDTLTLTPAESMSLEDVANVETFDRQVRRDRGSFSPQSSPTGRRAHQGGRMTRQSERSRPPTAASLSSGDMGTGVFQSATSLLGRPAMPTGGAAVEEGGSRPRGGLYSEDTGTGEFQSATSLFGRQGSPPHLATSRMSSEETQRVRGSADMVDSGRPPPMGGGERL